jgi:hypothetical protein
VRRHVSCKKQKTNNKMQGFHHIMRLHSLPRAGALQLHESMRFALLPSVTISLVA